MGHVFILWRYCTTVRTYGYIGKSGIVSISTGRPCPEIYLGVDRALIIAALDSDFTSFTAAIEISEDEGSARSQGWCA